jgi:Na+-driven multidrug efflux pump
MSWQTPYVFYISAIGKIKLELFIAIFQLLIYLPLALFLAKFIGLNLVGIILATNINILIPAILIYIQYKKLIYNNAYGIWAQ